MTKEGLSSTRVAGGHRYVLVSEYTTSANTVKLHYKLFAADAPSKLLAEAELSSLIDQDLEERIGEAIALLLRKAGVLTVHSPKAEIKDLLPGLAPVAPGAKEDVAAEEPPAASGHSNPSVKVSVVPEPLPAKTGEGKAGGLRFESAVSTAGLVLFGDATEYFHYGAEATASAGAVWLREILSIALDFRLSTMWVFNDQGVNGGPLYFTTLGPDVSLGISRSKPYRASVNLSSGAALITVGDSSTMLTKTVPYANIGVGMGIPVGRGFFLGGMMRFLAIFDPDLLILGATPSVTLGMER